MNMKFLIALAFVSLLLAGCNGSGDGRITIALTDTPMDNASAAVVEITGVVFDPSTGNAITHTFSTPQQIDFVPLQNGVRTRLISSFTLPPGHYQDLELQIAATGSGTDSYLTLKDGTQHALILGPTGVQGTRVRYLTGGFDISADKTRYYTIDLDLRKSVLNPTPPSTTYVLEPKLRMVEDNTVGNIMGTISSGLVGSGCTPVVYTYAGSVTTFTDLDNTAAQSTQPVTESPVTLNSSSGQYEFTAGYLPAGPYTVAFTCDAAADNPAQADALTFTSSGTVPAVSGGTILVNMH